MYESELLFAWLLRACIFFELVISEILSLIFVFSTKLFSGSIISSLDLEFFVTQWANEVIDCPETASKISWSFTLQRIIFCLWFRGSTSIMLICLSLSFLLGLNP